MEFSEVVRARRMVRNYAAGRPVEPAAVDRIVDAARRAPTAGFAQGQRFVVVTDERRREAIAALGREPEFTARGFPAWLSSAPVHVVTCADVGAYRKRYAADDKPGERGPSAWPVPYWYVDAGAALMGLLLAAVDEGLAAGFLGIHVFDRDGLRDLLGIPDAVEPVGLVTVGHPAPDPRSASVARGRRPLQQIVGYERWPEG